MIISFCLLYVAAGIAGADINVEGMEGGEVFFQCSHRFAWKNNKYICKDPCRDSEDTLVTVKPGGRAASGRMTLVDSGDGAFTVNFSQLQLSDCGRYWCAVERPGFDSFIGVHVTVKEAVANETTTVIPEPSSTWTYQNISNSTQLTSEMDVSRPANISTASDSTDEGVWSSSTSAVLYATVGPVAVLTFSTLAMIIRKHRENAKPRPQACADADEREADSEYDDIWEEVQSIKQISEDLSTAPSTAVGCAAPFHIYENVFYSKDKHDIYIKPLPSISERISDGCQNK